MEWLDKLLQTAEKWDSKYIIAATVAVRALSPTEEIAERRIKKYLSKNRLEEFNLANSHSMALFRRHLLLTASEWEDKLYKPGRVVMMATFVDQDWAFPDHKIAFDFKAARQKVRNAFAGMDYIGAFESAVYPDEEVTTESGTGFLVSFHAHVIVWSTSETKLRAHKLKIGKRFTLQAGDEKLSFPRRDQLTTTADFRKSLRNATKMPVVYERVEEDDPISRRHANFENIRYYRLTSFLHHHTMFEAWVAGGEGRQILKSAKSEAIEAAEDISLFLNAVRIPDRIKIHPDF